MPGNETTSISQTTTTLENTTDDPTNELADTSTESEVTTTPAEETTEPETEPVTTKPVPVNNTVTFTNSLRWGGPIYCYYWSDSNSAMTSWPGKVMDFLKTNDYGEDMFTFEVPAEATYIIFTNNKSQTVDIPYPGGEMRYYAISETDSKGAYKYGTW
jgi:alpha-amylase